MKAKRGRPLGYKLSETTKIAISKSKIGQRHSQETKDKISRSLITYFKLKNPLSSELLNSYCRYPDQTTDIVYDWICTSKDSIDDSDDILTYRNIYNIRRQEFSCIVNIDELSHNINPELLIMFKQQYESAENKDKKSE